MNSNGLTINGRTAISVGLVLALVSALVGSAVAWGRMQQQVCAKLDQAEAERDFVRKADLSRQLDSIDRRLTRIEEKLDRALQARQACEGLDPAASCGSAGLAARSGSGARLQAIGLNIASSQTPGGELLARQ